MDTAAPSSYFHVVSARRAHLLLVKTWPAENRMGVRIDEARHKHASRAIDAIGVRIFLLELLLCPNLDDTLAISDNSGRLHNAAIRELAAAARSWCTRTRHDLRGIREKKHWALSYLARHLLRNGSA